MANTRWHYEMQIAETPGGLLRRVNVSVSFADKPDRPVGVVTGFVVQRQKPNSALAGTRWAPSPEDIASGLAPPPPSGPSPTPPTPGPTPPGTPSEAEQ